MRTTLFADVIVPLAVPNFFTYRIPEVLNEEAVPGKRVLVQFGKTKIYTGLIYKVHETAPKEYAAKYIEAILDDRPVVTETQLKFWDWLAFYYFAYPGEVMQAALPSGLKLSSTSHVQLHPELEVADSMEGFSEKEQLVLESLAAGGTHSMDSLAGILKVKSAHTVINSLLKKNAIVVYEDVKERYKPKLESYLRLSDAFGDENNLKDCLDNLEKKAFKQAEALLYFLHLQKTDNQSKEWIRKNELLKKSDQSAIAGLVKKKILEEQKVEIGRLQYKKGEGMLKELSADQLICYKAIKNIHAENKVALLHGVTGSGKTEIYFKLIGDALEAGKQVLYLLPEIALSTQLIERLRKAFGEKVGLYHSRFSENERVEIWQNVLAAHETRQDKVQFQIIAGARSSLFLPFHNLGLIIVDEEHDSSFKQHDPAPRYHARDAAIYLSSLYNANVVLGSATPSVESFFNAGEKKYALVELREQFVRGGGTRLEVCDLKYFQKTNQMRASLTLPLYEAVKTALAKKQQVILFQNRRGFAPYTECRQCGHVPQCIQCDVSLIYHKQQQKLICHYCGYSISPPRTCAACGSSELHYRGLGTERIEEDIEILFPEAKISRMDLDSTRSKYAYRQLIDDFETGSTDILIGTQMVTKGLDFGNVSVVGVLNADSLLNFPDFRAAEKAYQVLTQVRGRAGRSHEKGEVYIQTTHPEHPIVELVKNNDYKGFYEAVLNERKQFFFPPFSRLIEMTVISKEASELEQLSNELSVLLQANFQGQILGPEFPLIPRIKNQLHKRLLLKLAKNQSPSAVRQALSQALTELQNRHKSWRYRVNVNVDPQ